MSDLRETRKDWAERQNAHLRSTDSPARVDHRSYADQAGAAVENAKAAIEAGDEVAAEQHLAHAEKLMEKRPQMHMGPAVWNMEKRALAKAEAEGKPYAPVTDRMKMALENGSAPEPFASAYKASN